MITRRRSLPAVVPGLALALVAVLGGGCGDPPPAAVGEDRLQLELGGEGRPIADLLPSKSGEPAPVVVPRPPELPPRHLFRIAKLRPGETLGQLCERELGTSSVWREIAALNGWDAADVNTLQVGQEVRLPIERRR